MTIEEKLRKLRAEMEKRGVDAYLITGSDPHQSEYVAPRWRTRAYITGFTGSAGTVVITRDKALLWVDSRYFIQSVDETNGTEYVIMKPELGDDNYFEWLKKNLKKGEVLSVEATEISMTAFKKLSDTLESIRVEASSGILDAVWSDRPSVPETGVEEMKLEYAGLSCEDKIRNVRKVLEEKNLAWTFISSVDDIAWLTNLRADDILYNPVFMSYMFISMDKAVLFTSLDRFKSLEGYPFEIHPYEECHNYLENNLSGPGYYNPDRVVVAFSDLLLKEGNKTGIDITTNMKARKNAIELEGMRRSHLQDGVAFVNFMAHLDPENNSYDEIAISDAFERERSRRPGYLGPSFGPISGFKAHGAMCHYSATEDSKSRIEGSGLLVLDTGGQYEFGMTDLTRTLLFGTPTEEEKKDYTLVLKGHLALAFQRFPEGTRGTQLDILARQYLWQEGMTFFHGTGHGVGCRLNVHEGPMNISTRFVDVPLEPGMVISDEPGVYKEGRHGIRIENLVAVREDVRTEFGSFLSFETLTLVPYEKKLIDTRYLTDLEKKLVNLYHKWVHDELYNLVDEDARAYLDEATSPLS